MVNCEAQAWIQHRIHPKDVNKETVIAHDKKAIDDPRVQMTDSSQDTAGFGYIPPSPVSPVGGPAYNLLARTLHKCYG
jgi:hypothetical protein